MTACGQGASPSGNSSSAEEPSWQEQYDLGIRYLSEGKYEEAILAFTAAIEIDPKRAPAYVGRGQAYVLSDDTGENLTAAQADFETAIELDETLAEAWLGLADISTRRGDFDRALEILQEGLARTSNDPSIADRISEIENSEFSGSPNRVVRYDHYSETGELESYMIEFFGEDGGLEHRENYTADGTLVNCDLYYFSEDGLRFYYEVVTADGIRTHLSEEMYNENGEFLYRTIYSYDVNGELMGYGRQYEDGHSISYDASGNIQAQYDTSGRLTGYYASGRWITVE